MKQINKNILMKKVVLFISVLGLFIFAKGQENTIGKVLLPSIAEEYKGESKKGLAHGEGVAKGNDVYVGSFKKGFPHNKGKYIWKSGDFYEGNFKKGLRSGYGEYYYRSNGKDTVMIGFWDKDKYIGESRVPTPEYKLLRKYNIERVRFAKSNNKGNQIRISFDQNIMRPFDIRADGSSGIASTEGSFIGFLEVKFPFMGTLIYQCPNKLNSAIFQRELEFVIDKPGNWTVYVTN
jgi:hypothetical protein